MQNPFGPAIGSVVDDLAEIEWEAPYIQSLVGFVAVALVLAILTVLYPTAGVLLQVTDILFRVIEKEYKRLQAASPYQYAGYAVSLGLLLLVTTPIILLAAPFYLLGEGARWLVARIQESATQDQHRPYTTGSKSSTTGDSQTQGTSDTRKG